MKKLLIIMAGATLMMTGCKKKNVEPDLGSSTTNTTEIANPKILDVPAACQNKISVDPSLIAPTNYQDWQEANKDAICYRDERRIIIDLDKVGSKAAQAEWLDVNGHLINYLESSEFIEDYHHIKDENLIKLLSEIPAAHYFNKKVKEIVTAITPIAYETGQYKQYMGLEITGPTLNVRLANRSDSDTAAIHYSIPFLRSVIWKNKLNPDSEILFAEYTIDGKATIFFKINNVFYDFSDEPKK